jgi:hypothetical protein
LKFPFIKPDYNKKILKDILKKYRLSKDSDDLEFVDFIKKHMEWADRLFDVDYAPAFIFGGEWTLDYINKDYVLRSIDDFPVVKYRGKDIYLPKNMKKDAWIPYIRSVDIEQDRRSAHCYFIETPDLKNKIVVDIGGAEGNFALEYIEDIKKLYIFEAELEWIEPLRRTFLKWLDKVEIINSFVGDGTNNTVKLDDFFKNKVKPDIIKIDVEGAEVDVLKGSRGLIDTSDKLTMYVCLYHSGNDETDIIKSIPNYSCSIRNGKMFYLWERPIKEPYLRHGVAEFRRETK